MDISIKCDEEKFEEFKKIKEMMKNEEIFGKIEKMKFIWLLGKCVDIVFGFINFFL